LTFRLRPRRNPIKTPIIETINLTKVHGEGAEAVRAVDSVSLQVHQGDYVAIMGASGSGKSTFMNMLGCLDHPSAGRLKIEGVDTTTLDDDALTAIRGAKIGFVFQQFNLLPRTSALENVALPLVYANAPRDERLSAAREQLMAVGLDDRARHTPQQLSGGQQQRVAIARALVRRPSILLADEPTGALDSRTSAEIMAIFARLNSQGMTIVLVTHDEQVSDHARRKILFRDGRIISDRAVAAPLAPA
jgi:putative ABC transport system ATP-binding protein